MSRALKARLRNRFVVTLKSGAAFDGVLWHVDRDVWVLRSATALGTGPRGTAVGMDGEVVLLAAEIDYAQKP